MDCPVCAMPEEEGDAHEDCWDAQQPEPYHPDLGLFEWQRKVYEALTYGNSFVTIRWDRRSGKTSVMRALEESV